MAPDPPDRGHDARDPDLDELAREAGAAARTLSGAIAGATLLVLHAVVGVLTASLASIAPAWAVAALLVVWAGVGALAWRWRQRRPIVAMLAPFSTAALVLTTLALGAGSLGWGS